MFLPRISLLSWILALLLTGCGHGAGPVGERLDIAEVVVGSGDVTPAVLARVRDSVATELVPLRQVFGDMEIQRFFVHVHGSRADMPAALGASLHQDSPGFAMLGTHQIHIVWGEIRRTGASPRGVVVHELVHELLDQYVAPHGREIPRWFHEGLAQLLAGDTYLGAREEDLVWRIAARQLRSFGSLRAAFPDDSLGLRTAYAQSYSYVAWLAREFGLPLLLRVARNADDLTSFERALVGLTGRTTLQLEDGWRDHVLHGSGAPWRVLLDSWFSLVLIAALPILVLALMRRLQSEERAARRLAARALADQAAAEAAEAAAAAAREQALADREDVTGAGG